MPEDIRCPICSLNLQVFTDRQREEHCDACLDGDHSPPRNSDNNNESSGRELAPLTSVAIIKKAGEDEQSGATELPLSPPEKSGAGWLSILGKRARSPSTSSSSRVAHSSRSSGSAHLGQGKQETSRAVVKREPRPVPFYKTLDFGDTKLAVDAFNYGALPAVQAYFLTHFHADHYGGLGRNWTHGTIYCSAATARLAALKLKVKPEFLHPLEMNIEHTVHDVSVLLLDANHCPGAVVFLFNKHTLHTGDFRATPGLARQLKQITPVLSRTYLDTTYLDPVRRFPSQDIVVDVCAEYVKLQQEQPVRPSFFRTQPDKRRVLVIVGTYTIGKERLAVRIAHELSSTIWTTPFKRKILDTIDDPAINSLLSDDGLTSQVHLAGMNELSLAKLEEKWKFLKKHFTHLIAFVPTGWTWPAKSTSFDLNSLNDRRTTTVSPGGMIRICRVPYSEHSSHQELEQFCRAMPSKRLIATVHTSHYDILKRWEA